MEKRFKILIVPYRKGRVREYSIGVRGIRLIEFGVVLLVLMMAILGYSTYAYLKLRQTSDIVTEKNQLLSSNIEIIEAKLNELIGEQQRVKQLYSKLKLLFLDEASKTNIAIGPIQEKAIDSGFTRLILENGETDLSEELRVLQYKVANAIDDTVLVQKNLDDFFHFIDERKTQLFSTPTIMPTKGWVSSDFGYRISPKLGMERFHEGLDIASQVGNPILATADGIVTFSGTYGNYGNTVIIDHGFGLTTRYGHNRKNVVKVGEEVKRGQKIALLGNTGSSTGPHCHYEVRLNGYPVDPRKYIIDLDQQSIQ